MFSKSCQYAIRAAIIICKNSREGRKTNVGEIAKKAGVPEQYIAKLLQILSRNNLVLSVKGPGGGFYLDPKGPKIKLVDLVMAIDGKETFTSCGLGLEKCSEVEPCPLHESFKTIRNKFHQMLETTTLQSLSEKLEESIFVERTLKELKHN